MIRYLDPLVIQPKLIRASLFIAAFELLKDTVANYIHSVFGDNPNNHSILEMLEWFKENQVLNDEDLYAYKRLTDIRNELVHELAETIMSDKELFLEERFEEITNLLSKIELWWIKSIEIPANPDFDGKKITDGEIESGNLILLNILRDCANGSTAYLDAWKILRKKI